MSVPNLLDITIYKGGNFERVIKAEGDDGLPVPIGGSRGELHVRSSPTDPAILLNLTTENGGIVIDPHRHTLRIILSAAQTSQLTFAAGVYDLFLTDISGNVTPFLAGSFQTIQPVTTAPRQRVSTTVSSTFYLDQSRVAQTVSSTFYINR